MNSLPIPSSPYSGVLVPFVAFLTHIIEDLLCHLIFSDWVAQKICVTYIIFLLVGGLLALIIFYMNKKKDSSADPLTTRFFEVADYLIEKRVVDSKKHLAKIIEVCPSRFSRNNKAKPTIKMVEAAIQKLHFNPNYLFFGKGAKVLEIHVVIPKDIIVK